jgi:hypothetical protein
MGGAPQVAMHVASQIWQIVFSSQTLQVFCFCFTNPLGFSFGPSQKGTICSSGSYTSMFNFNQPIFRLKIFFHAKYKDFHKSIKVYR